MAGAGRIYDHGEFRRVLTITNSASTRIIAVCGASESELLAFTPTTNAKMASGDTPDAYGRAVLTLIDSIDEVARCARRTQELSSIPHPSVFPKSRTGSTRRRSPGWKGSVANEFAKLSPGPEKWTKWNIKPEQGVREAKHCKITP